MFGPKIYALVALMWWQAGTDAAHPYVVVQQRHLDFDWCQRNLDNLRATETLWACVREDQIPSSMLK
jgi:hypothetical protein